MYSVNSKIYNQNLYPSSKLYGLDKILIKELELENNTIIPITIPHGIMLANVYCDDIDIHCHEPIYMAFTDEIYNLSLIHI